MGAGCRTPARSEEHTSELQSRFGISYAVFCLKNKIRSLTPMTLVRPAALLRHVAVVPHARACGTSCCASRAPPPKPGAVVLPLFFFLMNRGPPRSTPLSLHDALPI